MKRRHRSLQDLFALVVTNDIVSHGKSLLPGCLPRQNGL
jgi:hypothetical protein